MHYAPEIMARKLDKVPVLILRPSNVYGLDEKYNSYGPNSFLRSAQKDSRIMLIGGGEENRDQIYVDDVIALTVRCLLQRNIGVFNLAAWLSKCFYEVAELVARQFKSEIAIIKTSRANIITHRHYDVTNLIKSFPKFSLVSIEEGVTRVKQEAIKNCEKHQK